MGDTCNTMAISVSDVSKPFKLWDRGQLIVLLSRTRAMVNNIFVGSKETQLMSLKIINHACEVV